MFHDVFSGCAVRSAYSLVPDIFLVCRLARMLIVISYDGRRHDKELNKLRRDLGDSKGFQEDSEKLSTELRHATSALTRPTLLSGPRWFEKHFPNNTRSVCAGTSNMLVRVETRFLGVEPVLETCG